MAYESPPITYLVEYVLKEWIVNVFGVVVGGVFVNGALADGAVGRASMIVLHDVWVLMHGHGL